MRNILIYFRCTENNDLLTKEIHMKLYHEEDNIKIYYGGAIEVMDELYRQNIKFDAIIADPPYGRIKRSSWDNIIPLDDMWRCIKNVRKENTPAVIFGQVPFDKVLGVSNIKELRYEWIWEKTQATGHLNAKRMPMKAHENILVFYKKLPIYNPQKTHGHKPINSYTKYISTQNNTEIYGKMGREISGGGETDRYPRSVIKFKSDKQTSKLHSTQKPLALMEYLVKTYTNKGDLVLDFAAGSFTTAVACKKLGRKFIGIELEEEYCEIGKNRIQGVII